MLEKKLLLDTYDKVVEFVRLSETKDYEITLREGSLTVNAKLISEVFKLDLTKPVYMTAKCELVAEFAKQIRPYLCDGE